MVEYNDFLPNSPDNSSENQLSENEAIDEYIDSNPFMISRLQEQFPNMSVREAVEKVIFDDPFVNQDDRLQNPGELPDPPESPADSNNDVGDGVKDTIDKGRETIEDNLPDLNPGDVFGNTGNTGNTGNSGNTGVASEIFPFLDLMNQGNNENSSNNGGLIPNPFSGLDDAVIRIMVVGFAGLIAYEVVKNGSR
jgi:hypothetical protein